MQQARHLHMDDVTYIFLHRAQNKRSTSPCSIMCVTQATRESNNAHHDVSQILPHDASHMFQRNNTISNTERQGRPKIKIDFPSFKTNKSQKEQQEHAQLRQQTPGDCHMKRLTIMTATIVR